MNKIYIAFYDDEDGGSRENWNTFYTPWVASTTREGAKALAEQKIQEMVAEHILDEYGIDISTMKREDMDAATLEEIDHEIKRYAITVQEGDLVIATS